MDSALSFSAADLAQTRFAVSPMWEVVTSFRLLRHDNPPPLHRRWANQVRPRVRAAGLDRGRLAALVPPRGYLADFLTPTPAGPFPTLEGELDAIERTPAEQIARDLETLGITPRNPPGNPPANPPGNLPGTTPAPLAGLRDELLTYWELALAPTGRASAASSKPMCSTAPARSPNTDRRACSASSTRPCAGTTARSGSSGGPARSPGTRRGRGCC
ncbi:hypothetical protein AB6O49_17895 [Streptomyces sp. SBR177]